MYSRVFSVFLVSTFIVGCNDSEQAFSVSDEALILDVTLEGVDYTNVSNQQNNIVAYSVNRPDLPLGRDITITGSYRDGRDVTQNIIENYLASDISSASMTWVEGSLVLDTSALTYGDKAIVDNIDNITVNGYREFTMTEPTLDQVAIDDLDDTSVIQGNDIRIIISGVLSDSTSASDAALQALVPSEVLSASSWDNGEVTIQTDLLPNNTYTLISTDTLQSFSGTQSISLTLVGLTDTDNDGISDTYDAFPFDATEYQDTDRDGLGNNIDDDDDNDGVSDDADDLPFDIDNDGIVNYIDTDDDNDGLLDTTERTLGWDPLVVNTGTQIASADYDGDGLTNSQEQDYGTSLISNDSDSDGLSDSVEITTQNNVSSDEQSNWNPLIANTGEYASTSDYDGDGLTNVQEGAAETSLVLSDSDSDGINDLTEFTYSWDPLDSNSPSGGGSGDVDGDGLTNAQEVNDYGSDPTAVDTDGDGLFDNVEVSLGWNVAIANSGTQSASGDFDGDGLLNNYEVVLGTSLIESDSDGDGVNDYDEAIQGSDPLDASSSTAVDSDSDGISDNLEIAQGWDENDANDPVGGAMGDIDSDGLLNRQEAIIGTDPSSADSDSDGINDIHELTYSWDPISATSPSNGGSGDADSDGLSNSDEIYTYTTNPTNVDSDSDGYQDNIEVLYSSSGWDPVDDTLPNSTDSDSDGLTNVAEIALGTNPTSSDTDGDGWLDFFELQNSWDPIDSGSPSFATTDDNDGDGLDNISEINGNTDYLLQDTDGDGANDNIDAFPVDATETLDTDNDGTGNNTDTDDDNDGTPDSSDAFPLDATEDTDSDGDGTGDNTDSTPDGVITTVTLSPSTSSVAKGVNISVGISGTMTSSAAASVSDLQALLSSSLSSYVSWSGSTATISTTSLSTGSYSFFDTTGITVSSGSNSFTVTAAELSTVTISALSASSVAQGIDITFTVSGALTDSSAISASSELSAYLDTSTASNIAWSGLNATLDTTSMSVSTHDIFDTALITPTGTNSLSVTTAVVSDVTTTSFSATTETQGTDITFTVSGTYTNGNSITNGTELNSYLHSDVSSDVSWSGLTATLDTASLSSSATLFDNVTVTGTNSVTINVPSAFSSGDACAVGYDSAYISTADLTTYNPLVGGFVGYETDGVGTYYCPPTATEMINAGYSIGSGDYTSTVTDGNANTLVTMTSAQASSFCSAAYTGGKLATDLALRALSSNAGMLASNNGLIGATYDWPYITPITDPIALFQPNYPFYLTRGALYIWSSGTIGDEFTLNALEYSAFGGSTATDGVTAASASDTGIVTCFVPD
ncbi:hypothetical protein N9R79_03420 [Vibrio sp.]|nr:hypothetical protein [Vibrio sp.]